MDKKYIIAGLIIISLLIVAIVIWPQSKEAYCAKQTGFNLQDLDPNATTTTMGINRDKYEACLKKYS